MLCHHCGTKYGKVMITSIHFEEAECSCCHKITNVTEDRVYGWPSYPGNSLSKEAQDILQRSIDFANS